MLGFLKIGAAPILIAVVLVGICLAWYYHRGHPGGQLSVEARDSCLVLAELLKTAEEDIKLLNSADAKGITPEDLRRCESSAKAMEIWLNEKEGTLLALSKQSGINEKARVELSDSAKKLRSLLTALSTEIKPRIGAAATVTPPVEPRDLQTDRSEPILTKWLNRSVKIEPVKDPSIPEQVLTTFVDRYTNPEIRFTPYYFKNIRIIRAAKANKSGVYCISFQAEVFLRENDSRWAKSPVVLNVIAVETPEGVISTYENFAEKPWGLPRDGACVHSLWDVSDYEWCETCPYPCMSSYSPVFSRSSEH